MIDTPLRASSLCHGRRSGLEDATHRSEGDRELRSSKYSRRNAKKSERTKLKCVDTVGLLAQRVGQLFHVVWCLRQGRRTK